jgi:hypothetical protein
MPPRLPTKRGIFVVKNHLHSIFKMFILQIMLAPEVGMKHCLFDASIERHGTLRALYLYLLCRVGTKSLSESQ